MPKDNNTTSVTIKEEHVIRKERRKRKKEEVGSEVEDLLLEMVSAGLSSVGEVLHVRYAHRRIDGKPRVTSSDNTIDITPEDDD